MDSRSSVAHLPIKVGIFLLAFIVMSFAILHRPNPKFRDFDQIFYVTIAYDLDNAASSATAFSTLSPAQLFDRPPVCFLVRYFLRSSLQR
jgi:hypothetical protein